MFLIFRRDGAKDWTSNLQISLNHQGHQHKLQFHHIFPQAVLKPHYSTREINDIANLAFIGGKTNRKIWKNPPESYFQEILDKQGSACFQKQCIPTAAEVLKITEYPQFLVERRSQIASRINAFLEAII